MGAKAASLGFPGNLEVEHSGLLAMPASNKTQLPGWPVWGLDRSRPATLQERTPNFLAPARQAPPPSAFTHQSPKTPCKGPAQAEQGERSEQGEGTSSRGLQVMSDGDSARGGTKGLHRQWECR